MTFYHCSLGDLRLFCRLEAYHEAVLAGRYAGRDEALSGDDKGIGRKGIQDGLTNQILRQLGTQTREAACVAASGCIELNVFQTRLRQ